MNSIKIKAQELLKRHSVEYVIEKMDKEKTVRITTAQIRRIIETLNKTI